MAPRARLTAGCLVRSFIALLAANRDTKYHRIVHFNHAGASPSPLAVTDRVQRHAHEEQVLGGYAAAAAAAGDLSQVYSAIADLIDANPTEIALVESATVAWTRLFYSFAQHIENTKRHQHPTADTSTTTTIWISEAEYAASVVAACQWARTHPGWTVRALPSVCDPVTGKRSTGKVDLALFRKMLQERTAEPAIVCVTHVPTNSGIVNPVQEIGTMIANYNDLHAQASTGDLPPMLYLVDACQSVGQLQVSVREIPCHGLVATGRKFLRAPRGTGFLYCPDKIASCIMPSHIDHSGVPVRAVPVLSDTNLSMQQPIEDLLEFSPVAGAKRFEFWESNVASKLGIGEAVRVAQAETLPRIAAAIQIFSDELYGRLAETDRVRLHHRPECGIVTFWVDDVEASQIKELLWKHDADGTRLEVSVVPATSTPLDSARTRVPDLLRASVSYTNSMDDILLLCSRLSSIIESV